MDSAMTVGPCAAGAAGQRFRMFFHHKELAYTVRVDKPNPVFGRMLQQAIGGPEGEMRVMNQYLFQAWGARGDKKYRDMLLHTGTEEIGHIEVLAKAVAMNLDGMPSEKIDDVVTNPLVTANLAAPEDVLDEGEYKQYAYAFFGHGEEPMDPSARWLTGRSPDGKGEFSFADPAPRLGQEPQLAAAPESVHAGFDATRTNGGGSGGMMGKVKDAITGD
jgi:Mn-containing catalase